MSESAPRAAGLWLAGRLTVPAETAALLWDMDGVLLDTLSLDYAVVNGLLAKLAPGVAISTARIRALFALDPVMFWAEILAGEGIALDEARFSAVVDEYDELRGVAVPAVHAGIVEILAAARDTGVKLAVVSNNPEAAVTVMLTNTGLIGHVDLVVGNDRPGLAKKPAPDPYLEAARRLDVEPVRCVVIEDSLIGAEAGRRAGCYTVAVATGACDLDELAASALVDASYASFATTSGAA